jgi:hypothetical protein
MRKISAGASVLALIVVTAAACDTSHPAVTKNDAAPTASQPPAATGTTGTASPAPVEPVEPAKPSEPANRTAAPAAREITIPAGTTLSVRLQSPIGSDTSRPEQRIDGMLTRDVRIGGVEALGAGASLRGIVTNAERSGRVKGRANVAFKFDHISSGGTLYPISTRTISRVAPGTKKRDAATIGIPAAGGAIIGGIIGGGDAAVKGGAIGGAAGTAAVLSTRGKEVRLGAGTVVTVRLAAPLTVRVK